MTDEPLISTVAVATDGSETAGTAVRTAVELARGLDARLVLLSAFEPSGNAPPASESIELQWVTSSSARVRSLLENVEAEVKADGLECATRAEEGDPAEVLVRLASAAGADLLVIGNKGMHRRMLGSVPNTISHTADCSVLVVKTT